MGGKPAALAHGRDCAMAACRLAGGGVVCVWSRAYGLLRRSHCLNFHLPNGVLSRFLLRTADNVARNAGPAARQRPLPSCEAAKHFWKAVGVSTTIIAVAQAGGCRQCGRRQDSSTRAHRIATRVLAAAQAASTGAEGGPLVRQYKMRYTLHWQDAVYASRAAVLLISTP